MQLLAAFEKQIQMAHKGFFQKKINLICSLSNYKSSYLIILLGFKKGIRPNNVQKKTQRKKMPCRLVRSKPFILGNGFLSSTSPHVLLWLVGGFNPFEKYARQIGSFPKKIGVKFQKIIWVATTYRVFCQVTA